MLVQNPFTLQDLSNRTELKFSVLHVTFGAYWFIGAAIGMLAGELLLDYVLTAGVGALASVSSKVRWLLNGYRGTKLLIKGGLKTLGKWVFDRTLKGLKYLDASVVAPAMARLSSGRQAVVARLLDDTAASTRKAVAD